MKKQETGFLNRTKSKIAQQAVAQLLLTSPCKVYSENSDERREGNTWPFE